MPSWSWSHDPARSRQYTMFTVWGHPIDGGLNLDVATEMIRSYLGSCSVTIELVLKPWLLFQRLKYVHAQYRRRIRLVPMSHSNVSKCAYVNKSSRGQDTLQGVHESHVYTRTRLLCSASVASSHDITGCTCVDQNPWLASPSTPGDLSGHTRMDQMGKRNNYLDHGVHEKCTSRPDEHNIGMVLGRTSSAWRNRAWL